MALSVEKISGFCYNEAMIEKVPASEVKEGNVPVSLPNLTAGIRSVLQHALSAEQETPPLQRLRKLHQRLESKEIADVLDGDWVAQTYQAKMSEGDDHPVITKSDTGNKAIVITFEQMQNMVALSYIDPSGAMQVFDDQMMEDAGTAAIVIFPDEIGNRSA
jgi:hypothetical protein